MGLFDDIQPVEGYDQATGRTRLTVRPLAQAAPQDTQPEGFRANNRGFTIEDVQAALRGDALNSPGLPIKYGAQPGQTFGVQATQNAQPFDSIVAHHTASPTLDSALNSARRGDPFGNKFGYHFYIDKDGTVVQGAPLDARTNHVQPSTAATRTARPDINNTNAVGISFVGNDSSNVTPEQLAAAQNLSRALMDRYGIKTENVVGHGEIQASRQPGEGMPLVNALRSEPAVASQQGPRLDMGATANAEPPRAKTTGLFDDLPSSKPDIGQGRAALEGFLSGASANFSDEVYGASKASGLPDWMGGFRAPVGAARLIMDYLSSNPSEATAIYEKARDEKRGIQKQAKEQYPGTYMAGEVGGALVVPTGRLQAATLPGRMGRGAAFGAAYGGASGVGAGENAQDRAIGGVSGAMTGGALGAAAPPVVEGAIQAGRAMTRPVANSLRGIVNPEAEAARRVGVALDRDIGADPQAVSRLSAPEFAAASQGGGPARVMDIGGDATRALARSAANTSTEGRGILDRTINERFDEQAPRIASWLRNTFHFPDVQGQQQAIEQAARNVNAARYGQAMQDGARGVWDAELQRLAGAPAIQEAARAAVPSLANRGISEGFAAARQNPLGFDPATGRAFLTQLPNGNTRVPDLRFWDQVKRNLDGEIGKANRAGDRPRVSELTGLRSELVANLDRIVPSYAQARAGAAHFFGAENALEAGQNFVGASAKYGLPQARAALARMSPQERQLFQDGYVSRLVETIEKTGDRRNIVNQIAQTPAARQEIQMALGPQRAAELEAVLRIEGIMDLARGAVQGNSTTARQLVELGLAGGVGGIGYLSSDPGAVMNAALVWGAARGHRAIDARVAQRVAQMLTSRDPHVLQQGVQMVARSNQILAQLRRVDGSLARVATQSTPRPAIQLPVAGRAEDQQQ